MLDYRRAYTFPAILVLAGPSKLARATMFLITLFLRCVRAIVIGLRSREPAPPDELVAQIKSAIEESR